MWVLLTGVSHSKGRLIKTGGVSAFSFSLDLALPQCQNEGK